MAYNSIKNNYYKLLIYILIILLLLMLYLGSTNLVEGNTCMNTTDSIVNGGLLNIISSFFLSNLNKSGSFIFPLKLNVLATLNLKEGLVVELSSKPILFTIFILGIKQKEFFLHIDAMNWISQVLVLSS